MFKEGDFLVVNIKFKQLVRFNMPKMANENIDVQECDGNICVVLKETNDSFIIYSFKNGCCYKWPFYQQKPKEIKRMKQYWDLYIPKKR